MIKSDNHVSVNVEESGNYKVKVKLHAYKAEKGVCVYLNRRRLVDILDFSADEDIEKSYIVNVCQLIPCEFDDPKEYVDMIRIEILVPTESVKIIDYSYEPWEGATCYIAGDSTVTDQSAEVPFIAAETYAGWGQMLSYYTGEDYAISNHAHSGLTTETFRSEGHYKNITDNIKKGDICIFQFGHNDQKIWYLMAEDGYRKNLKKYINEIRELGGQPVLATSLVRNTWNRDSSYNDLLTEYAEEVIKIGKEMDVPVLDLHKRSKEFVMKTGRIDTSSYLHPGDATHSNDYGAYKFAGFIYEEMKNHSLFKTRDIDIYEYEPSKAEVNINTIDNKTKKNEKIVAGDIAENGLSQTESIIAAIKKAKEEYRQYIEQK